jgi:NhaB family Na+:H+ antiporter
VEKVELIVQVVASVFLVVSLCMHLTEVGFVGLGIAILVTTCTGKIEEHDVSLSVVFQCVPIRPVCWH